MAPGPYWKGYLKLSLVSCSIALYPAIEASERVSFRQVNKQTGNGPRQQLVIPSRARWSKFRTKALV
jgi:DNA end-binding protein Ku